MYFQSLGTPTVFQLYAGGKDLSHIFSLLFVLLCSLICTSAAVDQGVCYWMVWGCRRCCGMYFFAYLRSWQRFRWGIKFSSNIEWWLEGILGGRVVQLPRKCKSNSKGLQRNLSSFEYLQGWRFHNCSGPLFQYSINLMLKRIFLRKVSQNLTYSNLLVLSSPIPMYQTPPHRPGLS